MDKNWFTIALLLLLLFLAHNDIFINFFTRIELQTTLH